MTIKKLINKYEERLAILKDNFKLYKKGLTSFDKIDNHPYEWDIKNTKEIICDLNKVQ